MTKVGFSLLLVVAMTAPLLPRSARAEETCILCHRQLREARLRRPAVEWPTSIHAQEEVSCVLCHGGNGEDETVSAHDPGRGFVGHLSPMQQAERCGGCRGSTEGDHAPDEASDAWARWRQSAHGRAAEAGSFAPGCADCHGAHAVHEVTDPRASVSRANVVETCAYCHADPGLMADTTLPDDQYDQYVESVHGRKLAEGDPDVPTCADCHDAHGARHGTEAAATGCKHCHEEIGAAFDRGRHHEVFANYGFVDCVECHGSHEVAEPGAWLIGGGAQAACRRCHGRGQEVFDKVRKLGVDVNRAEQALAAASDEKRDELEETRRGMVLALHALDIDGVSGAADRIVSSVGPVHTPDAPGAQSSHQPAHAGRAFWSAVVLGALFLLTLMGGVLVGRARRRRS